jgi:S1-C subfamily serine protease
MNRLALPAAFLLSATLVAEDPPSPKHATFGAQTRVPEWEEEEALKLDDGSGDDCPGVVVDETDEGGPAAKAGIRVGDAILAVAGRPVYNADGLQDFARTTPPGTVVEVKVRRSDTLKDEAVKLTLGSKDGAAWTGIAWTCSGPEGLIEALAEAKKAGKRVLVGLSGSEG